MAKIINVAILALITMSCAHQNPRIQGQPCMTTCGVRLFGSNDCRGFQEAEDRAVKIFDAYYPSTCDRLYGWVVYVQPSELANGAWQSPSGKMVVGLTWCRQQTIQVENDYWKFSSLAHELLHAVECGERTMSGDPHTGWDFGWQTDAIRRAQ